MVRPESDSPGEWKKPNIHVPPSINSNGRLRAAQAILFILLAASAAFSLLQFSFPYAELGEGKAHILFFVVISQSESFLSFFLDSRNSIHRHRRLPLPAFLFHCLITERKEPAGLLRTHMPVNEKPLKASREEDKLPRISHCSSLIDGT